MDPLVMDNSQELSEVLQQEYQERFEGNASYRLKVWNVLCESFFSKFIKKNDVILDLGAGWGEFSKSVEAKKLYAMDLNPDTGVFLEGISEFVQQDCSKKWPFDPDHLDVIFSSNFLEHLPNKPLVDATLGHAFDSLKKGGRAIFMGPNIKYVPGQYWDFWDHYIQLTEISLSEALKMQGFEIEYCVGRFLPYSMSEGLNPPTIFLKLYLKMPFVWPIFGKQFLVVAKKA